MPAAELSHATKRRDEVQSALSGLTFGVGEEEVGGVCVCGSGCCCRALPLPSSLPSVAVVTLQVTAFFNTATRNADDVTVTTFLRGLQVGVARG